MSNSSFVRDFQRLDANIKLIAFGVLLAFVSLFLPWFQSTIPISKEIDIYNAFTRFGIFGGVSLFFTLLSAIAFVQHFFGQARTYGFEHSRLWIFCGGQALFALTIALFVFAAEQRESLTDSMRFGLFTCLFGHLMILFGGYLARRNDIRQNGVEAFTHPPVGSMGNVHIRPEEPEVSADQLSFVDNNE